MTDARATFGNGGSREPELVSSLEERGWLAMLRALEAAHTTDVAEAYARGERCLTVVYGPVETDEEQADLGALCARLWALAQTLGGNQSQLLRTLGCDDRSTWWWGSTTSLPADVITDHAADVANSLSRSWWRISQDPE